MWTCIRQWLGTWGNLALTVAIALAAIAQAAFAKRLWQLENRIEAERRRVDIFVAFGFDDERGYQRLLVRIANLSSSGVWLESLDCSAAIKRIEDSSELGTNAWSHRFRMVLKEYSNVTLSIHDTVTGAMDLNHTYECTIEAKARYLDNRKPAVSSARRAVLVLQGPMKLVRFTEQQ
jgi:hypothetical protein